MTPKDMRQFMRQIDEAIEDTAEAWRGRKLYLGPPELTLEFHRMSDSEAAEVGIQGNGRGVALMKVDGRIVDIVDGDDEANYARMAATYFGATRPD